MFMYALDVDIDIFLFLFSSEVNFSVFGNDDNMFYLT